jgi:hypothetical protein
MHPQYADWKLRIRSSLYCRNLEDLLEETHNLYYFQERISEQREAAQPNLRHARTIDLQEEALSDPPSHPLSYQNLPAPRFIFTLEVLDIIFPFPIDSALKIKLEQEIVAKLESVQGKDKQAIFDIWKVLREKYLCPLDVLGRFEVYLGTYQQGKERVVETCRLV